jgi:hypothetical protein
MEFEHHLKSLQERLDELEARFRKLTHK